MLMHVIKGSNSNSNVKKRHHMKCFSKEKQFKFNEMNNFYDHNVMNLFSLCKI